jgi:hypothetical protein
VTGSAISDLQDSFGGVHQAFGVGTRLTANPKSAGAHRSDGAHREGRSRFRRIPAERLDEI